jgi:streptomycin 6-kinase
MNERYNFTENEIETIVNRFGKDFYEKVLKDIETYADRWALSDVQLIPSYSVNIVFSCFSDRYGDAVLKIGHPLNGAPFTEYNTLRQYNGRRFCKVFDADPENGILLEECVQPGNPLRNEASLDRRLSVFCSLYKGLHEAPVHPEGYPSYTAWVGRITEYMSKRQDCKELHLYMRRAEEICCSVAAAHTQTMLLHGDFHHDNILLGPGGEYKIIDPKGVIGDPVFDVPRFILNEFDEEKTEELYRKITHIIQVFEKDLAIPSDILKKCLFVETAMGVCWSVESGAAPEEYAGLLRDVAFAESILYSSSL